MSRSVVLTAATEDTEIFRSKLDDRPVTLLHYPLEKYREIEGDQAILDTLQQLDEYENIVHGSKRNAQFFVRKVKELEKLEVARNQLNFALNQYTADYLEEEGIPAVHPHSQGRAIDLLEFLLRTKRIGKTLYPCGDKTTEDLPGLLHELEIPVEELVLFTLEGPAEEDLQQFRKDLAAHEPEVIIFHSRRSVNRMLAAFQNLNFDKAHVFSGDKAVTEKLKTEDIDVDAQAEGSWDSIIELIEEIL